MSKKPIVEIWGVLIGFLAILIFIMIAYSCKLIPSP